MLTPQDLQEIGFQSAKFGGYVKSEVDEFLEPLLDDYVTLYKENAVLKSKMRLLVERLENYRANEANMKTALEQAQKTCDDMIEEARRRSEEIVSQANQDAASKTKDVDSAVSAETDRLQKAKEATAEFVTAVEAQLAREQQILSALKNLELPLEKAASKPVRRAYDYESEKDPPRPERGSEKPEDIAAQIEENVSRITGDSPRPRPDPSAPTRVMPVLDERTTAKFANLQFGKNYQP
ncbi:MAG: DivIVA domain-containing protein [Oscillospiraceae bacterium]|nr:DivIVA domain-containing protein [Oscillospiraceae bacterium]